MRKFKFSIHPLFLVFVAALVYLGYFYVLLAYLITIILHELAHALVAQKLGYKLNHITLMPHGASLSGASKFYSAKDEILVAIAGPALNVVLAILGCALWWIFPDTYFYTQEFVYANTVTAIINCLPIFPLDGGRVLLAILGRNGKRSSAIKKVKITGIVFSCALIACFVITVFFVPNYTMLVFGSFLFITSILDDKSSYYDHIGILASKNSHLNRGLKVRTIAVPESMQLYKLMSAVTPDSITDFSVLDKDLKVIGKISENQLEKLIEIYPANTKLALIIEHGTR